MTDLKAARNATERAAGTERPRLSLQQYNAAVWESRATDYGASKYSRGNYHGPPPEGVDPVVQCVEYLDAAMRHLGKVAQAINVAYGTGGDVAAALACVDDEASAGFPPSMLPHLAHVLAGVSILIEVAVGAGLLPADPGQPWKQHPMYAESLARRGAARRGAAESAMPQKADPDTERARIEAMREARSVAGAIAGERELHGYAARVRAHAVAHIRSGVCVGTFVDEVAEGRVRCAPGKGCCRPGCPARRDTIVPPVTARDAAALRAEWREVDPLAPGCPPDLE